MKPRGNRRNPRVSRAVFSALLILSVLAVRAGTALAIPSPFTLPSTPGSTRSGDGDALSLSLNPAQLRWVTGASAGLVADYWSANATRSMRGTGLFVATPLFLGFSGGAALSWRRPGVAGLASDYVGLDLGLSLALGPNLGVGLSWERLLYGSASSRGAFALGVDTRLFSWLSVGAAVADIDRSRVVNEGARLPRRFLFDLTARPLADRRFEVGLGADLSDTDVYRLQPRARLEARVATGLRVFGELSWRRLPFSDGTSSVGERLAWAGMRFELDAADLAVAGGMRLDGSGDYFPGGSLQARFHADRREAFVSGATIAKVKLSDLGSDRAFAEMVLLLRRLAWDPGVAGVELNIGKLGLGLARIEELHSLIDRIRARKKVVAYLGEAKLSSYFLAAACDGILMDPSGSLFLGGLAHQVTYFKGALDKVGVAVEVERIAEYKGAMEPFLFEGGTQPVRENHAAILDDNFGRILASLSTRRRISEDMAKTLIDKAIFSPTEAKAANLVDVISEEEETEAVQRWFGRRWPVVPANTTRLAPETWFPKYVAVIVADGNIVEGDGKGFRFQDDAMVWSEAMIATLDAARMNPAIASVVLRINSPGGSAVASDQIARAVFRLRKAGKPVIASMGDVAASGGYYIAAPADRIYADPSTLTGSIGIYGYKADLGGLFAKVGLAVETLRRGERADFFSVHRPWTPSEREAVRGRLRGMYERFLKVVEDGRNDRGLDQAKVDSLGRGRVWTGSQAKQNGLVDELAGLSQAIDEAARRGGVRYGMDGTPSRLLLPRPSTSWLGELLRLPIPRAAASLLLPVLVDGAEGFQARLPYVVETD